MDYLGYSARETEDERLAEEAGPQVRRWITNNPALAEMITRVTYFSAKDIEEQMNMEHEEVRGILGVLSSQRMIYKTTHGYRKAAPFISLLKEKRVGD
jgi:hypothetical protein